MANPVELDRVDRKIIALLQSNARMSNLELAERVGLSPTPCARRLRLLEEKGVIAGYSARINLARLGKSLLVMAAVHLDSHTPAAVDVFERRIMDMPEVIEAYTVTGSNEYLLKIAVDDLHAYSDLQRKKLLTIPHVVTVDSMFILKEVKRGEVASL